MTYDLQLFDAAAGSLWFETGFKTGPLQTGLGVLTGNLMTSAVGSLKNLASAAISVGASFEAGMSEVQAISQIDTSTAAGAASMEKLTAKAKEMGATTKFSATEASEAMKYMAMAGWKTNDMLAGIDGIMNLAAASGESLGTVSDIVTDDLTAFGYSADQASHFADVLAAASSNANTNVSLMGETFKYVGPVAGALNYSIEDMAIATGLMANASIKGSMAGTAMRTMLTNLVKPSDQTAAAMERLGISITDDHGNMKSMQDLLLNLRSSFSGLSEAEQASYAAAIAGQRGMSGLLAIVNASDEDFNKLTTAIYNSEGAATTMANTMQDNLTGKVTILKSALEGLGISVFEKFSPELSSGVEAVTNAINTINDDVQNGELGESLDDLAAAMGDFLDRAIQLGQAALPVIIDKITWILNHSEELISAFMAFEIAKIVYRGVDAITALINGVSTLTTLIAANPLALLIASIAGLIAYVAIYTAMAEAAKDVTDGMTESEREAYNAAQDAIKSTQDLLSEIASTLAGYDQQADVAHDLVAEFEALEGLDDSASMERRKQIIAELNAMYPDLNAQIDAEGRLINTTTQEISDYIDMQTRRLKAAAAEDMLADIAKQQVENEIALKNEIKAKGEAQRRYNLALGEQIKAQEAYDRAADKNGFEVDRLGEANANLQAQKEILDAHVSTIDELTQAQADLGQTWTDLQEIITEVTPAIEEVSGAEQQAAESADDFARSLVNVDEEMVKAFEDIYQSAEKNILGAADIFKKADEETKASLNDMLTGLQANAQAYANYADNLATLLNFAHENVNAQGLVAELVNGGMDNAGRIQALVDAINAGNAQVDEVITAFNDAEAARQEATLALTEATYQANNGFDTIEYEAVASTVLGEQVSSITKPVTDATAEAQTAVDDATAAMKSSAETAATDTSEAVSTATEEITDTLTAASEDIPETVQETVDAVQQAVEDGHDPIVDATQTNIDDAMAVIDAAVDSSYEKGLATGQGYAKGLLDSAADVEAAANAVMRRLDALEGAANSAGSRAISGQSEQSAESVTERMISRAASLFSALPIAGIGGAGGQRTPITVVSELDGREIARGTSWYMGEQLAWEAR